MIKIKKLIEMAIDEAVKSDYKVKHSAIIFNKNIIISRAYNSISTYNRKLHPKFKKRLSQGLHAETAAILSARSDLSGCAMLIIRINKRKQLLMSKPCEYCMKYIEYVGIKKVIYSINCYPYIQEIKL